MTLTNHTQTPQQTPRNTPANPSQHTPPYPLGCVCAPDGASPAQKKGSASRAAGAHAPFVFVVGEKSKSARYAPAGRKAEEKLGVLCRVLAVAGYSYPDISRGAEFFAKFHHNRRQDEWQP